MHASPTAAVALLEPRVLCRGKLEKAPRQGLMGKTAEHFERQALHLIQREPVERGGIAIQNQDADVGSGRLMQDFY